MNLFNNKRSEIVTIIFLTIIFSAIALFALIDISSRECRSDSQCPADNYCGSDFSCHQIPTIEKTVVKNNLILPSIIIGIAIIIAAIVLRFGKIYPSKKNEAPKQPSSENTNKNLLKIP